MIERPQEGDASPHMFTYINQVSGNDPVGELERQMANSLRLFSGITKERSLERYAPEKWSIRELVSHVTDTERAFAFRVLWFSRGFEAALPGYDQEIAAAGAEADSVSWDAHVEEFRQVRLSTISLFRNMPRAGWVRGGVANNNRITVRALAYVIPGHVEHHLGILRERYLGLPV